MTVGSEKYWFFDKAIYGSIREYYVEGEGDGTAWAVINQLWDRLLLEYKKYFLLNQQPIRQLVDNCTSSNNLYPLNRIFPGSKQKQAWFRSEHFMKWYYKLATLCSLV